MAKATCRLSAGSGLESGWKIRVRTMIMGPPQQGQSPVGWACTHAHHAISEYHSQRSPDEAWGSPGYSDPRKPAYRFALWRAFYERF